MHTHTRAGAGVSLLRDGLRPISQDVLQIFDDVAYHPYGIPASAEECEELGKTCQNGSCVVLLNHGLLSHAPTIHGALIRLYMMERSCELEVMARTMTGQIASIPQYVIDKAAERYAKIRLTEQYGFNEWTALVRTVERGGANFRH